MRTNFKLDKERALFSTEVHVEAQRETHPSTLKKYRAEGEIDLANEYLCLAEILRVHNIEQNDNTGLNVKSSTEKYTPERRKRFELDA